MRNAFFCVSILVFLVFSGNAFAAPSCNSLEFELYDAELWEGTSKAVTFALANYAAERFYIDKVNAYDFAQGIDIEEESWQDVVLSGGQALITVEVSAEHGAEKGDRTGKIQVKGHFLGGKECGYRNVQDEFNVLVLSWPVQKMEAKCEAFTLYTALEAYIDGFGIVKFIADNKSSFPALITLESNEAFIKDNTFYVPSHSEREFTAGVESDFAVSEILYNVKLSDCGIPSQHTTLYNMEWIEPVPTPTPSPAEMNGVEVSTSIARDGNGFLATVELYNPNDFDVTGSLGIEVPEDWVVIGSGVTTIEPFTRVRAALRVVPPEGFTGAYDAEVVFSYDGKEERDPVKLELEDGGIIGGLGAAFAVLGSSTILIGLLLVVVILIMILVAGPHVQDGQSWQEAKKK